MKRGCWLLFLALFALSGCAVDNNYLHPEDFADYLRRDGVEVGEVRKLSPDPFRASDAAAIMVSGSEIGVYKYDTTARVKRQWLEKVVKSKRLYICGIPYPVEVRGSFVFFGLDRNPAKRKILKTIQKFE